MGDFKPKSRLGKGILKANPEHAGWLQRSPTRDEAQADLDLVVDELLGVIKGLSDRLTEMETKGVRFRGVHQRANQYRRGDQVTYRSSLWAALGDVPEGCLPGTNPDYWQLAAKGANA